MSAEMDALVAAATQKLEALEAALYGLKQVRGRHTTDDGSVSVEVDSNGALVALSLSEAVTSRPPAEVGQAIIWACQQAAQDAGEQRSKVVSELNSTFVARHPGNVAGRAE
ncbi:YbaB/EbfC family nucleoid-associated protein [Nocardia sp. CDC159]|uniref:YbaB/EbfC family nucleoid-associated protein n=1 Tax=Nocardia pulmonis TaxID=2951408 RepID=A0A9X2IZ68_9NOCA|nr:MULTISPECIES: YbaB/EbfC family nucleoid-associated protein [Nocardia]MCM6777757.1 YbaB/EbfC family nucleoid-associated protein [Nocardia pulmonis]MCM6790642.1 YbaB/EbfC family nucleoid-associated protein [Nocardia sp. CDC159]